MTPPAEPWEPRLWRSGAPGVRPVSLPVEPARPRRVRDATLWLPDEPYPHLEPEDGREPIWVGLARDERSMVAQALERSEEIERAAPEGDSDWRSRRRRTLRGRLARLELELGRYEAWRAEMAERGV
jgi:hypothetical protein